MTLSRPQRISRIEPPGSLFKRITVAAPRRVLAEPSEGGDREYLALVRQLPCLKCGMEPCESCHVRFASAAYGKASGLGRKPEAKWCAPLCADDHRLARDAQHNRNEQEFWNSLGINPLAVCVALYRQRRDLVAMRAVVLVAIADRGKRP